MRSQAELMYLAAIPRQIISPQNNSIYCWYFQDSLLGCYRFTRKDIEFQCKNCYESYLCIFDKIDISMFKKNKRII